MSVVRSQRGPADGASPTSGGDAAAEHDPLSAYRLALRKTPRAELKAIVERVDSDAAVEGGPLETRITAVLSDPERTAGLLAALGDPARAVVRLFGLLDTHAVDATTLSTSLRLLGFELDVLSEMRSVGLLAFDPSDSPSDETTSDIGRWVAHPELLGGPQSGPYVKADAGTLVAGVRQVREADGLEPILRLAAIWQRVAEAPLRRTLSGVLFKRDRERLDTDPVVSGPIADSLHAVPDQETLWTSLALDVGLLREDRDEDRIIAAPDDFWSEHAVHLPWMLAARWLRTEAWHERTGASEENRTSAVPYRVAVLDHLAAAPRDSWARLDELAARLEALGSDPKSPQPEGGDPKRRRREGRPAGGATAELVEAILLGPAYQLGLVRAAETEIEGARVVQLTPLGRSVLGDGYPPPRETFEQFLFVQPNFEIIAYRQGLNPSLIGHLSRFAAWSKLGAAVELTLTPEAAYRGLGGGLTPDAILDRLKRHSARSLPHGIAEAVRTWANRHDLVTFHPAATLLEFATTDDLEAALRDWPEGSTVPVRVDDRLLLVDDDRRIPFERFRMAGSRDYRRPPEACVEVEPDGVSLSLDPTRADLFVEAEIGRLAQLVPPVPTRPGAIARRRYAVTPATIRAALEAGQTPASLDRWFHERTGAGMTAAIRLFLRAADPDGERPQTERCLVLNAPSADWVDGLIQYPPTGVLLGERLGPTSVLVPEASATRLAETLAGLLAHGRASADADPGDEEFRERGR